MKKSIQSPATGTFLGLVEFWLKSAGAAFYGTFDTHGVPVIIMDFKMSSSFHVQVYRMFTP